MKINNLYLIEKLYGRKDIEEVIMTKEQAEEWAGKTSFKKDDTCIGHPVRIGNKFEIKYNKKAIELYGEFAKINKI